MASWFYNLIRDISVYGGTIGVIVLAIWNFKTAQKLEIFKAQNEKINFITKTQFDTEFRIYQELSEASFNMLLDVTQLFPKGIDYLPEDKQKQKEIFIQRHKKVNSSLFDFQNKLYKYAPFIPEEIYNSFDKFREEARIQAIFYPDFIINPKSEFSKETSKERLECWKRTPKLYDMHQEINKSLREYLGSLKILE